MVGRIIIAHLLAEFIEYLRQSAKKKYGASSRADYVLTFLDGLENDILGFIDLDFKAPIVEIRPDKLRNK